MTGLSHTPALVLVAAAYTAGSVAGAALGGPWWLTAFLASLLGAAVLLRDGGTRWLVVLAAICAASAGHARLEASDAAPPPPLAAVRGVHEVVGVARDDAVTAGTRVRIDLDVESVDGTPVEGGLRLTLPAPRDPIQAGDRLRFTGAVEPPPALEAFDYAAFLRSRDIYVTSAFPSSWERLGRVDQGWRGDLAALQRETVSRIERSLPEPAAALAAGVLVGERRTMPADITEALRVTGTTHLVVVSGQNVALLLGLAVAAMTAVVSRRIAAIVALVLLPPYVVFVGADPPVVRAAVMAIGVAFASLGGRRTPGWVYLLHAVAVMLAIDPTLVRDVAFQLSATATAGVILVAPVLRDAALSRWGALQRPALAAVVETFATATGAALAVLPVQVAAFERLSPWTVPANVAIAPLYEATVAVAALAGALGGFEVAAGGLRETARFVPEAFLAVVQVFARLPAADVPVSAPLLAGLAFVAALIVGLRWLASRTAETPALDPGHRTGLGATVALAAVAAGLWLAVLRPGDDLARVTVLDVGQGLAILVQDAGRAVLIDTGPADGAVLRALPAAGVRAGLDAVVFTHADLDHTGGIAALLRRLEVDAVLGDPAVLAVAGLDGSAIDIGDRVRLSERVSIEVLAPPVVTRGRAHASSNDASLVLLVTMGERRILLPADIEASAEAWLIESGQPLAADVLVIPHHGSRTSSTPTFVEAVAPAVAVVSAGAGNPFGHPLPEVLARYEGAAVLRTDLHGSVTLSSDGERLWWRTER
ncbi:MAG: DNA internalization-related competence protein ComEC/Rec2 [Dehalococcoidia bacterium]|nr:DNA internalization-related competence protein ComEC/Rec2 [Dehalococcoidia bacterium]